ncbi:ORF6N domain-containing protein [Pectobacterium brasiliense]|uniref:ORF6N domain-containing protein n=1 Tax=Pectobacterium brasiliense TaxID=180957 RepID=UPI00301646E1
MTTQLSAENLSVVSHHGVPVITTELMASLYCTERQRITNNFNRNKERFTEGKHYYKLTDEELRNFKHGNSLRVPANIRAIILWTQRGAARHAKMLETDQAWEVFEKLEDFYFSQREKRVEEPVRKTKQSTAKQLTPLRQTVERLITSGVGNIYPDIWKLVHHRFDVETITQLLPEQIDEAIIYLDGLEGEFIGKQAMPSKSPLSDEDLQVLCWLWSYAGYMCDYMKQVHPILRAAEHRLAGAYLSMPLESPRTINAARKILLGVTEHIESGPTRQDNWRVLYRMRHEHDIHPSIGE